MQPSRRMPSPPPQSQKKTVTWHDFLKETKELSWQEALLETHFESTTTNKPGLSSWQDFLRQTSDSGAALSSSPSPPDSPKLDNEPPAESKDKGRISPAQGSSPPTGSSPPALSNIPDAGNRASAVRPASQMGNKEVKVTGSREKGFVCKITSQTSMEELSPAQLPMNSLDLQQLICKKNPQLRIINPSVFPSLSNLTVLWIEKAALQDLPVEMFTLTKPRLGADEIVQLEHLFLGHNQLRDIPAELGRLVNLKKLNLQHNQIVDLPQTIRHLTQLRSLYAHYNNLLRLPVGLCELEQLREITVQYNPLITPPAFICTKGVDDIKKWLAFINQIVNEAPQRNKINFTRNMSFTTSDDSFGILRKDGVHVSKRNPWFVETKPHIFFILDAATAATSGRREYMEDRHMNTQLQVRAQADVEAYYYGVYDGHCGDTTAEYLKQNMHKILEKQPEFHPDSLEAALTKTYAEAEAGWMSVAKAQTPYVPSGATALSLVIMQNTLTVAWCGDSRAVICQGTKAARLSRDHKPKLPDEEKRIKDLGGIVDVSDEGVYRVMGVLAVSRALGDIDLKEPVPYVSPIPEVKSMVLTPRDQFIIAASDGVWDVFSDQSAVDMVRRYGTAQEAADAIIGHVNARKAKDNATCTVIMLHWDVRFPN